MKMNCIIFAANNSQVAILIHLRKLLLHIMLWCSVLTVIIYSIGGFHHHHGKLPCVAANHLVQGDLLGQVHAPNCAESHSHAHQHNTTSQCATQSFIGIPSKNPNLSKFFLAIYLVLNYSLFAIALWILSLFLHEKIKYHHAFVRLLLPGFKGLGWGLRAPPAFLTETVI